MADCILKLNFAKSIDMRLIAFALLLLATSACVKKQQRFTKEEIDAKVDSIYKAKLPALKKQAEEDFKNRLSIELKPKIDSILNVSYEVPEAPQLEGDDEPIDSMGIPDLTQPQE